VSLHHAEEVERQHRTTWKQRRAVLGEMAAVFAPAFAPIAFFTLAAVDMLSIAAAFNLAQYSLAALLALYGFLSRRLSGGSVAASVGVAVVAIVLGTMLAELKNIADVVKKL
jgi:hypothetical protein